MSSRVLIVDDEPDILFMIKVILRSEGYEVVAASGVAEARAQLSEDNPDLVLLDLRLADGEGWDVLRDLREDGRLERVPVVILSAHASPGTIQRALSEGAAGYVTKPFVTSELVGAVREHAYGN
ncbi:MAG: response regulator [Actinobacteria bacterium]|nr:MAG: response regulator [Actinomycetota bacterium]